MAGGMVDGFTPSLKRVMPAAASKGSTPRVTPGTSRVDAVRGAGTPRRVERFLARAKKAAPSSGKATVSYSTLKGAPWKSMSPFLMAAIMSACWEALGHTRATLERVKLAGQLKNRDSSQGWVVYTKRSVVEALRMPAARARARG